MNRKIQGEYTPVKKEIPDEEYVQALYLIRSEMHLLQRRAELIEQSPPPPDGQPNGKGGISDPTAAKAVKLDAIDRRLKAIAESLEIVPEEYREAVKGWIQHKGWSREKALRKYSVYCAGSTLSYWRIAYVQEVAKRAGISI